MNRNNSNSQPDKETATELAEGEDVAGEEIEMTTLDNSEKDADEPERDAGGALGPSTKVEQSIARLRNEDGRSGKNAKQRIDERRNASRRSYAANNRMWSGNSDEPVDAFATELASGAADDSDLLDIFRRQWRQIAAIVVVAVIAGAVILSQLTPLYTAKAELIIETQRPALPGLEAVLPGLGTDKQSIVTETAVLRSGVLLGSVVERLDLVNDPEFNSALRPPGIVTRIMRWVGLSSQATAAETRPSLIKNSLSSHLEVTEVRDSRVIAINVTSESGDKAAQITNTLVDEYIESRRRGKFQASSETSLWLDDRIADLQAKLLESEKRVEQFRSDAELLETGGTTLISQQLADLNGFIMGARAATAAAMAELTQVSDLIESTDSRGIYASDGVLQSPLVQELRTQQVVLDREIAELSSELGPAHPRMIRLRADAADLNGQIFIEVERVEQGLRNAVRVAEAREKGLERQVAELKTRLSHTNEDEIQLRALEREAEANRQLLETLLARRKELGSPDQLQTGQPDARVISYAAVPARPSFPQMGISMAGIFIVSIIIAFVVAFIREIRRQGFTTLEQLEAVNKLTALGFVPLVPSRRQQSKMLDAIVTNPGLPFAQAMRTLNWQLDESMPGNANVILVTSSIPGEGKTTTAIGIARTKALKGHKTLIIDADIRNPSIHTRLELAQSPGLRDVIEGNIAVTDAILVDKVSSLHVLPAGKASSDALALLESRSTEAILMKLIDRYDYIIMDSPPIASAPDACVLSKLADATIFTVRWSKTPVNAVKYALRILERNGGHVTGTLLTMVEVSNSLNRNYGYFGHYGDYGDVEESTGN